LFSLSDDGVAIVRETLNINPYLVAGRNIIVSKRSLHLSDVAEMNYGNYPGDGTHLTLSAAEASEVIERRPDLKTIIRPVYGAKEFINGLSRYCLWIDDADLEAARSDARVLARIEAVRQHRLQSDDVSLNKLARRPHQYRDRNVAKSHLILVPTVSSEQREYITPDLKTGHCVTTNQAFALYDAPFWNLALIASRMHVVWIATVCGKHESRYRYSNTLGWNTFPLPTLTDKMKSDLTRCAEDILLAREAHFPATVADLYDPEIMPADLRAAHERNDEVLERIYIGRRFKNDTERLEKLFELYTKLTNAEKSREKKASA
jgi:hypothetical protein